MKERGMRVLAAALCLCLLAAALGGCGRTEEETQTGTQTAGGTKTTAAAADEDGETGGTAVTVVGDYSVNYTDKDTDTAVESGARHITLADDGITFDGTSSLAQVNGSVITITAGGTYVVSGQLSDGQIVVNEPKAETVRLVLDGVNITCQNSAPLYVMEGKKVVLVLAEGSENIFTDGESYVLADETSGEPNAAIFSKADLTVTGSGALTVNARYNNGINSKDKLKITGGVITVDAVGNGLKGKDCVAIAGGDITVTAGCDGLKSSNTAEVDAGFVRLDGGNVRITAGQDGVQAATGLVIAGGTLSVTSGGGSANASTQTGSDDRPGGWGFWGGGSTAETEGDTASAKGLKAALDITVTGGDITVDSSDDAVHSNGTVGIAGGTLNLTSGDDGVHADSTLAIAGGELAVNRSYEGLEGQVISISGGTIHVTASDDGLNAAGGSDGSSVNGRPGQNGFAADGQASLEISGGYLVVNAAGDGLDSNNTLTITGGTVLVYGPTDSANGAIDYETSFTMDGGTLAAAGSSGMAESVTGGQAHSLFLVCAQQTAGTLVRVEDSKGSEVMTLAPAKAFSSVVLSTPAMQEGETYTVYLGGSSTGETADGVVSGGTYTPGETSAEVTLSGVSTTVNLGGSAGGMGGGFGGMGGGPMGGRGR